MSACGVFFFFSFERGGPDVPTFTRATTISAVKSARYKLRGWRDSRSRGYAHERLRKAWRAAACTYSYKLVCLHVRHILAPVSVCISIPPHYLEMTASVMSRQVIVRFAGCQFLTWNTVQAEWTRN